MAAKVACAGLCLACARALVGCQSQAAAPAVTNRSAVRTTGSNVVSAPAHRPSPDQLVSTDPSAMRLHDIGGAMLYYFALNKRLPRTMEELRPFADDGTQLDFNSPYNHQPYGYAPSGLSLEGRNKRIVAYDPAPRDGKRWCIFMAMTRPGEAQSIEVLELPEGVFRLYALAGE